VAKPNITWTPALVRNAEGDNKAAGFIAMSPREFIALTSPGEHWIAEEQGVAKPLDSYNRWAKEGVIRIGPFLKVDKASGKVIGHEGRHRAIALMNAGGDEMLVSVALAEDGYARRGLGPDDIPRVLIGQFLPRAIARRGSGFTIKDVLEVSKEAHPDLKGAAVKKSIGDLPILKFGFGPGDYNDWEEFEADKQRRLGHLKKCAVSATVAHKLDDPEHDTTEVCLTKNQAQRLFGQSPTKAERLGCGAFACAWKLPNGKVAKITTDPDDVSALLHAQGIDHVPKVHKAYKLVDSGRLEGDGDERDVYGMVLDNAGVSFAQIEQGEYDGPGELQIYPQILQELPVRAIIDAMWIVKHEDDEGRVAKRPDPDSFVDREGCEGIAADLADDDDVIEEMTGMCQRFVTGLVDTMTDMAQEGILWKDIHAGNLAVDPDNPENWSIVDLGFSGIDGEPDVPNLKGRGLAGARERKIKGTFCEREMSPKSSFDRRSFRYKPIGREGKSWGLFGCPEGQWDERRQSCKVGMKAYKILSAAPKRGACKRGRKITK
jgi:hypothetical protein